MRSLYYEAEIRSGITKGFSSHSYQHSIIVRRHHLRYQNTLAMSRLDSIARWIMQQLHRKEVIEGSEMEGRLVFLVQQEVLFCCVLSELQGVWDLGCYAPLELW